MKRRLTRLLLLSAVLLLISGCTGQNNNSSDDTSSSSTPPNGNSSSVSTHPSVALGELTVTVFQTGKSDCILIETEAGAALIDTADKGDGKDLVEELEKRNIRQLEFLLLTHLD